MAENFVSDLDPIVWWAVAGVVWIIVAIAVQIYRERAAERELNRALERGDWNAVSRMMSHERRREDYE